MDPAAPARHAALRHARQKGTTRSNQKQELPTTGQTPKAHGIGVKALWFLFVLFIPLIGVLVYLIVRGDSMHDRSVW